MEYVIGVIFGLMIAALWKAIDGLGDRSPTVDQSNSIAGGDIVGRDKITKQP